MSDDLDDRLNRALLSSARQTELYWRQQAEEYRASIAKDFNTALDVANREVVKIKDRIWKLERVSFAATAFREAVDDDRAAELDALLAALDALETKS